MLPRLFSFISGTRLTHAVGHLTRVTSEAKILCTGRSLLVQTVCVFRYTVSDNPLLQDGTRARTFVGSDMLPEGRQEVTSAHLLRHTGRPAGGGWGPSWSDPWGSLNINEDSGVQL